MTGRITLTKVVLEVVPTYSLMNNMIPKSCIKMIQRNFIWGNWDDNKHIHTVNWNSITNPKGNGGLGMRNITKMNKAYLDNLQLTNEQ